jgi:hypothetical protein
MTFPSASNTYESWSNSLWSDGGREFLNNGYPFLSWQTERHQLSYSPGTGGSFQVPGSYTRIPGADGPRIEAVPDPGFIFLGWSDGVKEAARTDRRIITDIEVTASFAEASPFTLMGAIPAEACEVQGGLFVAQKDGWIYVATNLPAPNGEDAFIYLSADPETLRPANWAKSGQVGTYSFMLAREGTNDFAGWFDGQDGFINESTNGFLASNRNGNLLEGTILRESITANAETFIALGLFGTDDAGALLGQSPLATANDGSIQAAEFLRLTGQNSPCAESDMWMIH